MIRGIGVGAGYDKNGYFVDALADAGADFVEVGTVTPLPQSEKPDAKLIIDWSNKTTFNTLGIPSIGFDRVRYNLLKRKSDIPILLNVAPNRGSADITKLSAMIDESPCRAGVVNPTSPNAPVTIPYTELSQIAETCSKPVWIKVADTLDIPDAFEGVIAINSQQSRAGSIIAEASLKALAWYVDRSIKTISVGGIMSSADIDKRIKMGAQAIEVVSALYLDGLSWFNKLRRTKRRLMVDHSEYIKCEYGFEGCGKSILVGCDITPRLCRDCVREKCKHKNVTDYRYQEVEEMGWTECKDCGQIFDVRGNGILKGAYEVD